jgi:DNA-binding transcriptional MerR regulator
MALTAGKAARMFGMSRTALLYYDEIGLVKPSRRSAAGYRLYEEADIGRLRRVIAYREAGIPLEDIAGLLSGSGDRLETVLLRRLEALNAEIAAVKRRQAAVVALIRSITGDTPEDARDQWRAALGEAGMQGGKGEEMHKNFEEHSPRLHAEFLRALGFDEEEVRIIREHYMRK